MKLNYAHLGNGLTFWDSSVYSSETRDSAIIAHADSNRNITFYKQLPTKDHQTIVNIVLTTDPEVSITQDQKVFNKPAKNIFSSNPKDYPQVKYKFHLYQGDDKDIYTPRPEQCPICKRFNFTITNSIRRCTYCHHTWKPKKKLK